MVTDHTTPRPWLSITIFNNQKSEDCSNITIMVIKVNRFGEFKNSKPCTSCQALLKKHGVRKVVYSDGLGHLVISKVSDL